MNGTHLRLEAVRTDAMQPGQAATAGSVASRRAALAAKLDSRLDALRRGSAHAAALLGYAILPWCDIALWSVAESGDIGGEGAVGWWTHHTTAARPPGYAWMQVELEHIDCALAYVERLPVRHALVAKAWRWRWSSAAWHCGFGGKPRVLAEEWTGPARRDLWRDRLAGAFVDRSDRSLPVTEPAFDGERPPPEIIGSAVDRLAERVAAHSPGMEPASGATADAMEPCHGELAVA